ncbi:MAG: response regulator [Candidatus Levybacteria bacterium]|nr:response regulator [Candidatus Levybacteria bacterium]
MTSRSIRVLAVEDDKFISRAYQAKFESEGFKVKFAHDGVEAIDLLKKYTPDVIILDILMPRSDGFSVLKKIQKNKKWADIPVIMATNLEGENNILKARDLNVDEYVVKSRLSLKDLVNRIHEIKNEL